MILDLIVAVILIVPMAIGFRRGLVNMFMRTFGWIAAVVAGFFLTRTSSEFLEESVIGTQIHQNISDRFAASVDSAVSTADGLPEIVRGGIAVTAGNSAEIFAGIVSSLIISVLAFIIVVFIVKIILRIFIRPAAGRKRRGLLSSSDRFLGLVVGFVEGVILVFLFLAALVPISNFVAPDTAVSIAEALRTSYAAGTLYDNNLLLLVTGGLFS